MSWPRPPFFFPTSFSLRKKRRCQKMQTCHTTHHPPPFSNAPKIFRRQSYKIRPFKPAQKTAFMPHWAVFVRHARSFGETTPAATPPFPLKFKFQPQKSNHTPKNCDFNCIISNLLHNRLHFRRKVQSSPLSVLLCLDIVDKTRCVAPAVALAAPLLPSLPLAPLQRLLHLPPGHHT